MEEGVIFPGKKMRQISLEELVKPECKKAWLALTREVPVYDIGQTYAWVTQWWNTYRCSGVGKKELLLLAGEDGSDFTYLWPLMIRRMGGGRVIEFVGQSGGMTTDYMAPIVRPGYEKQAVRNLLKYLFNNKSKWDVAALNIPTWAGYYPFLLESQNVKTGDMKPPLAWEVAIVDHTLAINLPNNFESYVSSLGKRTRADVRNYLKAAKQAAACLEIHSGPEILKLLPELYRLNAQNWNVFTSEDARQFMSNCVQDLIADGEPVAITKLSMNREILAIVLFFGSEERYFLHPAGVKREKVFKLSPGTTLYSMMIRNCILQGGNRLDMSPGVEEYKFRLGAVAEPVYQIRFWHQHSSMTRWRFIQWMRSKSLLRKCILTLKNASGWLTSCQKNGRVA